MLILCAVHVTDASASPKSGHPERVHSPSHAVTQPKQVRPFERFLKINVRHITDGQVSWQLILKYTRKIIFYKTWDKVHQNYLHRAYGSFKHENLGSFTRGFQRAIIANGFFYTGDSGIADFLRLLKKKNVRLNLRRTSFSNGDL